MKYIYTFATETEYNQSVYSLISPYVAYISDTGKIIYDGNYTGGGGGETNPFDVIGYPSTPSYIDDGIAYAEQIQSAWDPTTKSKSFQEDTNLVYFPLVDTSNLTTCYRLFRLCNFLQYVPAIPISNKCTDMTYMFGQCESLTSLDVSNWDTSNVKKMTNMFSHCTKLKSLDLSSFNTSNVKDMTYMFSNCTKLTSLDVSNWDTSNVTTMEYMFQYCTSLTSLDLSNFNTSNVTGMSSMFRNCTKLTSLDLSSFNTNNVTGMSHMFNTCSSLTSLDLSSFNTSNVKGMGEMFAACSKLTRVDGALSIAKLGNITYNYFTSYSSNTTIRKLTLKDLGYNSAQTSFNNNYMRVWGINTDEVPDARQSLIDTLITYSYDRATAGYSTETITLYSSVKALLTDEEIAQITAKGYTLA